MILRVSRCCHLFLITTHDFLLKTSFGWYQDGSCAIVAKLDVVEILIWQLVYLTWQFLALQSIRHDNWSRVLNYPVTETAIRPSLSNKMDNTWQYWISTSFLSYLVRGYRMLQCNSFSFLFNQCPLVGYLREVNVIIHQHYRDDEYYDIQYHTGN